MIEERLSDGPAVEEILELLGVAGPALTGVAFGGVSVAVLASTFALTASDSGLRPGGRVLSRRRPSTPSSPNRACQRHTQGFDLPVSRQIALTLSPSAVASTICARQTTLASVLRSLMSRSRRIRTCGVIVMSVFITTD